LSTALRQGTFQPLCSWLFFLPLAFIGFSPRLFSIHVQFNTLYQFWIHTKLVPKLGWFEYILNTPSQHRVHHGRNPYCIDKNYAATLSIWDRMFGTFAEEKDGSNGGEVEEVKYGLVHPPPSWEPVYANLEHWNVMRKRNQKLTGLVANLRTLFKGPAYNPGAADYVAPDVRSQPAVRWNPPISLALKGYVLVHWLVVFVPTIVFFQTARTYTEVSRIVTAFAHIWGFASVGYLMSHDSKAWIIEILRLAFVAVTSAVWWIDSIGELENSDNHITQIVVASLRDYFRFWPLVVRQSMTVLVVLSVIFAIVIGMPEQRRFVAGVKAAALARAKAKAEKAK